MRHPAARVHGIAHIRTYAAAGGFLFASCMNWSLLSAAEIRLFCINCVCTCEKRFQDILEIGEWLRKSAFLAGLLQAGRSAETVRNGYRGGKSIPHGMKLTRIGRCEYVTFL
jgi:hypothetical protein